MNISGAIIILAALALFYLYLLISKYVEGLETGKVRTWADVAAAFIAFVAWMVYIMAATNSFDKVIFTWLPK